MYASVYVPDVDDWVIINLRNTTWLLCSLYHNSEYILTLFNYLQNTIGYPVGIKEVVYLPFFKLWYFWLRLSILLNYRTFMLWAQVQEEYGWVLIMFSTGNLWPIESIVFSQSMLYSSKCFLVHSCMGVGNKIEANIYYYIKYSSGGDNREQPSWTLCLLGWDFQKFNPTTMQESEAFPSQSGMQLGENRGNDVFLM